MVKMKQIEPTFVDPFAEATYRALVDLGDDIQKLPSLYQNWSFEECLEDWMTVHYAWRVEK